MSRSWNSRSDESSRACASDGRSPNRRNSVPFPTPASSAIASIEVHATPSRVKAAGPAASSPLAAASGVRAFKRSVYSG